MTSDNNLKSKPSHSSDGEVLTQKIPIITAQDQSAKSNNDISILNFNDSLLKQQTAQRSQVVTQARQRENVLTFSHQSIHSDQVKQYQQNIEGGNTILSNEYLNRPTPVAQLDSSQITINAPPKADEDAIMTIIQAASPDESNIHFLQNSDLQITEQMDGDTTTKNHAEIVQLSDPVTHTVTQIDDHSQYTISGNQVNQKMPEIMRVSEDIRRTITEENNMKNIKLNAIRSKSSLIRVSSRQSPDYLQTQKFHDQEMQVDMSLSHPSDLANSQKQSSLPNTKFQMQKVKVQPTAILQELVQRTNMSPDEKINLIRQLGLDKHQLDQILQILQINKQNLHKKTKSNQYIVGVSGIDKRIQDFEQKIRYGFPSRDQIVLLILSSQDDIKAKKMKNSRHQNKSPSDAILYFLTYSDLLRLEKLQFETQTKLDNEKKIKLTKVQQTHFTKLKMEKHGIVANSQPIQAKFVQSAVDWKVKTDQHQSSLMERFLASLLQKGQALRLIRAHQQTLDTNRRIETQIYPASILQHPISTMYYVPVGQRHFKVQPSHIDGEINAGHNRGDSNFIQELATNVAIDTRIEGQGSNPQSTTSRIDDGRQSSPLALALFNNFLLDTSDLLGIKGIAKTKKIFKQVQKFWTQNRDEALIRLQELKDARTAQLNMPQMHIVAGSTTYRGGNSNGNRQQQEIARRSQTVDQESAVYLSTNQNSVSRGGDEYQRMDSPDYFFEQQLRQQQQRFQSFKTGHRDRGDTLYNHENESQVPTTALLPKKRIGQVKSGFNTSDKEELSMYTTPLNQQSAEERSQLTLLNLASDIIKNEDLAQHPEFIGIEEYKQKLQVLSDQNTIKAILTNTVPSPDQNKTSMEGRNKLNKDLFDPLLISKESSITKMELSKLDSSLVRTKKKDNYAGATGKLNRDHGQRNSSNPSQGTQNSQMSNSLQPISIFTKFPDQKKAREPRHDLSAKREQSRGHIGQIVISSNKVSQRNLTAFNSKKQQNNASPSFDKKSTQFNIKSAHHLNEEKFVIGQQLNNKAKQTMEEQQKLIENNSKNQTIQNRTQSFFNEANIASKRYQLQKKMGSTEESIMRYLKLQQNMESDRLKNNRTQQFLTYQEDGDDLESRHLSQTNFQIGGLTEQLNESIDHSQNTNMQLRGYNLKNLKKQSKQPSEVQQISNLIELNQQSILEQRRPTQPLPRNQSQPDYNISNRSRPYEQSEYKNSKAFQTVKGHSSVKNLASTTNTMSVQPQQRQQQYTHLITLKEKAPHPSTILNRDLHTSTEKPIWIVGTKQGSLGSSIDKVDSFATSVLESVNPHITITNQKGGVAMEKMAILEKMKKQSKNSPNVKESTKSQNKSRGRPTTVSRGSGVFQDDEQKSLQEMNELDRQISSSEAIGVTTRDKKQSELFKLSNGLKNDSQANSLGIQGINAAQLNAKSQGNLFGKKHQKLIGDDKKKGNRLQGNRSSGTTFNRKNVSFSGSNNVTVTMNNNAQQTSLRDYKDEQNDQNYESALDVLSSAKRINSGRVGGGGATISSQQIHQSNRTLREQNKNRQQMDLAATPIIPIHVQQYQMDIFNPSEKVYQQNQQNENFLLPQTGRSSEKRTVQKAKSTDQLDQHSSSGAQLHRSIMSKTEGLLNSRGERSTSNIEQVDQTQDSVKNIVVLKNTGTFKQFKRKNKSSLDSDKSRRAMSKEDTRKKGGLVKGLALVETNAQKYIDQIKLKQDARNKNEMKLLSEAYGQSNQIIVNKDSRNMRGVNSKDQSEHDTTMLVTRQVSQKSKQDDQIMNEMPSTSEYALILLNSDGKQIKGENDKYKLENKEQSIHEISIDNQIDNLKQELNIKETLIVHQHQKEGTVFDSLTAEDQEPISYHNSLQQRTLAHIESSEQIIEDDLNYNMQPSTDNNTFMNRRAPNEGGQMQTSITTRVKQSQQKKIVTKIESQRPPKAHNPSQSNSTLFHETRRTGQKQENMSSPEGKLTGGGSSIQNSRPKKNRIGEDFDIQNNTFDIVGHGEVSLNQMDVSGNSKNKLSNLPDSQLFSPERRGTSPFKGEDVASHSFKNELIRTQVRVATSDFRRRDSRLFTSGTETAQFQDLEEVKQSIHSSKKSDANHNNLAIKKIDELLRTSDQFNPSRAQKKSVYSSRKGTQTFNSRAQSQEGQKRIRNEQSAMYLSQLNNNDPQQEPYINMSDQVNIKEGLLTSEPSKKQLEQADKAHSRASKGSDEGPSDVNSKGLLPIKLSNKEQNAAISSEAEEQDHQKQLQALHEFMDNKEQQQQNSLQFYKNLSTPDPESEAISPKPKSPIKQNNNFSVSISQEMESLARNSSLVISSKNPLPRPIINKPQIKHSPSKNKDLQKELKNKATSAQQFFQMKDTQHIGGQNSLDNGDMYNSSPDIGSNDDLYSNKQDQMRLSRTRIIQSHIANNNNTYSTEGGQDQQANNMPIASNDSKDLQMDSDGLWHQRQDPGSLTMSNRFSMQNQQITTTANQLDKKQNLLVAVNNKKQQASLQELGADILDDSRNKIIGGEIVLDYQKYLESPSKADIEQTQQLRLQHTIITTQNSYIEGDDSRMMEDEEWLKKNKKYERAIIREYQQKQETSKYQGNPHQQQMLKRNMSIRTRKNQLVARKRQFGSKKFSQQVPSNTDKFGLNDNHYGLNQVVHAPGNKSSFLRIASAGKNNRQVADSNKTNSNVLRDAFSQILTDGAEEKLEQNSSHQERIQVPTKSGGEELLHNLSRDINMSTLTNKKENNTVDIESGRKTLKTQRAGSNINTQNNSQFLPPDNTNIQNRDVILNFNQNYMFPITITDKNGPITQQQIPETKSRQHMTQKTTNSNSIRQKLSTQKRQSSKQSDRNMLLDDLVNMSKQLQEQVQHEKSKADAKHIFPLAVLDIQNDFNQTSSSIRLKSNAAQNAMHQNYMNKRVKDMTMRGTMRGLAGKNTSEGKGVKSTASRGSNSRVGTAPGLTKSITSYGFNKVSQEEKQINSSIGFQDSTNGGNFVLTSNQIRPSQRITKTSHQQHRYGSNNQKKNLNLLLMECKGASDRVLQPVGLQEQPESNTIPSQIHQSELAYQTKMPFTSHHQTKLYRGRTMTNDLVNNTAGEKKAGAESSSGTGGAQIVAMGFATSDHKPYDNIYQTYRSIGLSSSKSNQQLKVVGTSASIGSMASAGIENSSQFIVPRGSSQLGPEQHVKLPAVKSSQSFRQQQQQQEKMDMHKILNQ